MKYILLLLILSTSAFASPPGWYYGTGEAVNLENRLKFKNKISVEAGSIDPTSVAVSATPGAIYLNLSGNAYIKQDAGLSTNWLKLVDSSEITSAVQSINGITATSQSIVVGSAGTDFNIATAGAIHTINLPVASATNTGKISNTDWINHQEAYTKVNTTTANAILVGDGENPVKGIVPSAQNEQPISDGTNWTSGIPFTALNNQTTTISTTQKLIEQHEQNYAVNKSFEHSTPDTGWTLSGTSITVISGSSAQDLSKSGSFNFDNATDYVQASEDLSHLNGSQGIASIWVNTTASAVWISESNVTTTASAIQATNDGKWNQYSIPFIISSSTDQGIKVWTSDATAKNVKIDNAYVGTIPNIMQLSGSAIALQNWFAEAVIYGTDVFTTNTASFQELTNSGLTMFNTTGSAITKIPCSSTNSPSGYTCSSGDESIGINVDIPQDASYEICMYYPVGVQTNTATNLQTTIVETPSNAQTILQKGGNTSYATFEANGVGTLGYKNSNTTCADLRLQAGNRTIRLFYKDGDSTAPRYATLPLASVNNQNMRISIKPSVSSLIQASFKNAVKTKGISTPVISSAEISSTETITNDDSTMLSSCTNAAPSVCTFTSNFWVSTPWCQAVSSKAGTGYAKVSARTTSTVTVERTDASEDFSLVCHGESEQQ